MVSALINLWRVLAVTSRAELVRLFDFEPDLLAAVPAADRNLAANRLVVETATFPRGPLDVASVDEADRTFGLLVLNGYVVRRVASFGRRAVEVLGEGDVLRPDFPRPRHDEASASWHASSDVRLGLLGERFQADVARWPALLGALIDRLSARCMDLSMQLSIAQIPNLELRILALLWHMAERWGTVGENGTMLRLPVDQSVLAELVSAQRPSVNAALRRLRERDVVVRVGPGRWILAGGYPTALRARVGVAA